METNTIICGDSLSVLKTFPDACIDCVVFSPPYDSIRDYCGYTLDLDALGKELYRVTKDGGIAACIIGDQTKDFAKSLTSFRLVINWVDNCGFRLFEACIYARHGRPGAFWNQRFRVDHEYIFLFLKGARPKHFDKSHMAVKAKYAGTEWHGTTRLTDGTLIKNDPKVCADTKCRGTIWKYSTSNTESNILKSKHPATMPDDLAVDLIRCFTKEDELVLDPTCGSGTTCVAAAHFKRKYIGIDISDEYVKIARQRVELEVTDKADVFGD